MKLPLIVPLKTSQKGLRKEVRSDIVPATKTQQQFFEQVVEGGPVLATRQSVNRAYGTFTIITPKYTY